MKIKISQSAYNELLTLLNNHKEYTHLRLEKGSCCNSLSVMLDVKKEYDIEDAVDSIKIVYSPDFHRKYKEITLVFRNEGFMIKGVLYDNVSSCNNHCDSKNCETCTSQKCCK